MCFYLVDDFTLNIKVSQVVLQGLDMTRCVAAVRQKNKPFCDGGHKVAGFKSEE